MESTFCKPCHPLQLSNPTSYNWSKFLQQYLHPCNTRFHWYATTLSWCILSLISLGGDVISPHRALTNMVQFQPHGSIWLNTGTNIHALISKVSKYRKPKWKWLCFKTVHVKNTLCRVSSDILMSQADKGTTIRIGIKIWNHFSESGVSW